MRPSHDEDLVKEIAANTALQPLLDDQVDANIVDRVISQRFANRFFTEQPVSSDTIKAILNISRFAPSGGNIQPWKVYALGGEQKKIISTAMLVEHEINSGGHMAEYKYYPDVLPDLYQQRKSEWGTIFYDFLGIRHNDEQARLHQAGRNLLFFDAPVGLLFTIDRSLEMGSWLDLGMFIQNVMICAKARGLDTCPQQSVARYHKVMRQHLPIGENELVVCGMAMGFADKTRMTDRRVINRVPLEDFASFHGL